MKSYYNENDKHAAQWLRNLIAKGLLPDGYVDERSIVDVRGGDLAGFGQCHFFAGIGGWPLALQIAGWDEPCWTGSCPCQPFSAAGKRKGKEDARHLWPELLRLISERNPLTVFGEQVESKDGRQWLSGVRSDVEVLGYRLGSSDLCAAGVAAPHRRQRLYWVAESEYTKRRTQFKEHAEPYGRNGLGGSGEPIRMVQSFIPRLEGHAGDGDGRNEPGRLTPEQDGSVTAAGAIGGMAKPECSEWREIADNRTDDFWKDGERAQGSGGIAGYRTARGMAESDGRQPRDGDLQRSWKHGQQPENGVAGGLELPTLDGRIERLPESIERSIELRCCPCDFWSDFDIIHCLDGKARRIKSAPQRMADGVPEGMGRLRSDDSKENQSYENLYFPLAVGVQSRVGKLRGYGNAIVPALAAEFIRAYQSERAA